MANFSEHRKWITCREVLEYLDITHTDLLHIVEQYLLAPYLDVRNLNCVCLPIVPLENHNEFLIDHVLGKCSTEFECFKAANNDSNYLKLDISLSCPKGIINASLTGRYEPHLFFEESKRVIPLHVHGLTAVDTNVFGNESYFLFNLYDFLFPKEEVFSLKDRSQQKIPPETEKQNETLCNSINGEPFLPNESPLKLKQSSAHQSEAKIYQGVPNEDFLLALGIMAKLIAEKYSNCKKGAGNYNSSAIKDLIESEIRKLLDPDKFYNPRLTNINKAISKGLKKLDERLK